MKPTSKKQLQLEFFPSLSQPFQGEKTPTATKWLLLQVRGCSLALGWWFNLCGRNVDDGWIFYQQKYVDLTMKHPDL